MKKIIGIMIFFLIAAGFCEIAFGEEKTVTVEGLIEKSGIKDAEEKIPESTKKLMHELGIEELSVESISRLSPIGFIKLAFKSAGDEIAKPLRSVAIVVGISVGIAVAKAFGEGKRIGKTVDTIGALCSIAAVITPVTEGIKRSCEAIKASGDFITCFAPVYAGAVVSSGHPAAAAGYNTVIFAAAQVAASVSEKIITPAVGIFLAFAVVGASTDSGLYELSETIKKVICWGLGIVITVFVGIFGLQSFVAVGADGITEKAAKFIVGSATPVVGGALADAYTAVKSCVKLVGGSIGSFGIAAVAIMNLPTVLNSVLWMAATGISSVLSRSLGAKSAENALKATNSAMSILFAVNMSFMMLCTVSTALLISTVNAG